uniref:Uncharacterized protein n=1 Tax=Arundo donax TaxID=35708 RepID=A0A0A8ZND3_ARUDO
MDIYIRLLAMEVISIRPQKILSNNIIESCIC